MVTNSFGKTATFMPKPVKEITDQECIVINQFGKATPLFMGKEYAGLSKMLYII